MRSRGQGGSSDIPSASAIVGSREELDPTYGRAPGLPRTSADFVCAAALRPGHKTAVSRVSCDREQFLRYPKRSPRYLLVVLEKGDDVLDVLRLGDAAERHAVAL